jgi:hypothetical protein
MNYRLKAGFKGMALAGGVLFCFAVWMFAGFIIHEGYVVSGIIIAIVIVLIGGFAANYYADWEV